MRKFIVIDVGASENRCMCNFKNVGTVMRVPNHTVFLKEDEKVDLMVDPKEVQKSIDISVVKQESSDFFPLRALVGDTAIKYKPVQERPSGNTYKSSQKVNYSSVLTTCALALYDSVEDTHDIALYLAMPPAEAKIRKDYIKEQFKGTYKIKLNMQQKEMTLNISDVEVYEESFLAMISFLFNENGTPTELSQKYQEGYLLSIDIGASTTDIVAIKDGEYLEHTGKTIKTGGNVVRDTLIDEITIDRGTEISTEMAAIGVEQGRIRNGNSWMRVDEQLNKAKEAYAEDVVSDLDTYFRGKKIPLQNFRAICVSGGGAKESVYRDDNGNEIKTTEPMSYFITQKLRERNEYVEVEGYKGNSREANTRGLYIRAKIDQLRKGNIALDDF